MAGMLTTSRNKMNSLEGLDLAIEVAGARSGRIERRTRAVRDKDTPRVQPRTRDRHRLELHVRLSFIAITPVVTLCS